MVKAAKGLEGPFNEAYRKGLKESLEKRKKEIDFHGAYEDMTEEEQWSIINPTHYKVIPAGDYPEGIEYTGLCKHMLEGTTLTPFQAHMFGQVLKYMTRLGKKDSLAQDANKIVWYAEYLRDTIEGKPRP